MFFAVAIVACKLQLESMPHLISHQCQPWWPPARSKQQQQQQQQQPQPQPKPQPQPQRQQQQQQRLAELQKFTSLKNKNLRPFGDDSPYVHKHFGDAAVRWL